MPRSPFIRAPFTPTETLILRAAGELLRTTAAEGNADVWHPAHQDMRLLAGSLGLTMTMFVTVLERFGLAGDAPADEPDSRNADLEAS